jgi:DNA-binding response OmpR family regulator
MRVLTVGADAHVVHAVEAAGFATNACTLQEALADADATVVLVAREADAAVLARARPDVAAIVVTRPGDAAARVRALEAGAADAFDATFAPSQMVARVGAAGRRAALVPKTPTELVADGCTIDLDRATARRDDVVQALTAREIALVRWLARNAGRVVPRTELLEHVFGVSPDVVTRSVDVAISALRAKLERDPRSPAIIVSVKGVGYVWAG